MPPGDILIGCFDNSRDIPYNERTQEFASITVVDPEGLWSAPDLSCEQQPGGRFIDGEVMGVAPVPEDVEGLIRSEVPGIEVDDDLIKPGYPGTEWHGELKHVMRDGESIAAVQVYQQRSRWEISVQRCEGVRIGNDS